MEKPPSWYIFFALFAGEKRYAYEVPKPNSKLVIVAQKTGDGIQSQRDSNRAGSEYAVTFSMARVGY